MSHKVGIVVDSTCDLTPQELKDLNVALVPLKVSFDEDTFYDSVEITPEQFYERLAVTALLPKTSQPSPAQYIAAFEQLQEAGCSEIVSLSISSGISGTYQSSVLAARDVEIPVHCIDSLTVTHGLSLLVMAACELRDRGLSAQEISDKIRTLIPETKLLFVIDSMDNLVKGGRAGRAAGVAAALLDIKPILTLDSAGVITPFKKFKGRKKAVAELSRHLATESAEKGSLRYALIYTDEPRDVELLREALKDVSVDGIEVHSGSNGPVIGTYVPKACGIAYYPDYLMN